jgi:hypothetical protein
VMNAINSCNLHHHLKEGEGQCFIIQPSSFILLPWRHEPATINRKRIK